MSKVSFNHSLTSALD